MADFKIPNAPEGKSLPARFRVFTKIPVNAILYKLIETLF